QENTAGQPLVKDARFEENLAHARENGIRAGAWFELTAADRKEAEAQADEIIRILNGADEENDTYSRTARVNGPVGIVVPAPEEESQTFSLTEAQWTENVLAVCDRIRGAGYEPLICGNVNVLVTQLDLIKLQNYGKWIINYDNDPYYPYPFSIWRCSAAGMINGIEGPVNLDVEVYSR
ncbi:MAG: hypothetical protein IJV26_00985, partial [Lachnospiraceae bacterium]|nr:hypothetical protein [Lachnospiraceae bacterium]